MTPSGIDRHLPGHGLAVAGLLHPLAHAVALVRCLLAHPLYLFQAVRLGLVYGFCHGFRPVKDRISWRLAMVLELPDVPHCLVCRWIASLQQRRAAGPADLAAWFERYRPFTTEAGIVPSPGLARPRPRFSIVMPVFDTPAPWLAAAIRSVRDQTYPHWELLCANDGSTAGHVRGQLDAAAKADYRIRAVHLSKNRGVSAASNVALQAACGDYVCFLDHDDVLEPQALHRFAEAVLGDGPDLLYSDEAITGIDIDDIISVCSTFVQLRLLSFPSLLRASDRGPHRTRVRDRAAGRGHAGLAGRRFGPPHSGKGSDGRPYSGRPLSLADQRNQPRPGASG